MEQGGVRPQLGALMRVAAALVLVLVFLTACRERGADGQGRGVSPILAGGRGLDHVGVAVRDLPAARMAYADTLGFRATHESRLPTGLQNVTIWFADTTYLELLSYYDREGAPEIAAILQRFEGGIFAGLAVESAQRTSEVLRSRGLDVAGPVSGFATIDAVGSEPVEMWRHVTFRQPVVPANAIFFIEYNREALGELSRSHPEFSPLNFTDHANGSQGIRAVWMAVADPTAATAAYESVGFAPGDELEVPYLSALGRSIPAGRGELLLLAPARGEGKVAAFLRQRGEGVMGVSLEVGELATTRDVLAARTGFRMATYEGLYGTSVLIPPELTHGLWIEMFQASTAVEE